MTRAEKKYTVAWNYAQAKYFAKSMDWIRAEWEYVNLRNWEPCLKGRYAIVLYDVRAPRYSADKFEAAAMERLQAELQIMVSSGRIARLNVVNLP